MSERADKPSRWRWIWGFTFLFLAHVALVFRFNERAQPAVVPEKVQPLIFLPSGPAAREAMAELGDADPMVFALASARGFSGEAWLNVKPMDVVSSNWSAPPSWLPLATNGLGEPIVVIAESNRVSADALLADLGGAAPFELRIPTEVLLPRSVFSIEGALAGRRLVHSPLLPAATNTDLLTNTVVELAVRGDGDVESTALVGECGLKAMDEAALGLARRFVFEPLALGRRDRERTIPQRGKLVFTWSVAQPPLTNTLTSATP